jgi:hypothetical protein
MSLVERGLIDELRHVVRRRYVMSASSAMTDVDAADLVLLLRC